MALDLLYQRATLKGVLDKTKPPYAFFRDTFFSRVNLLDQEHVVFDVRKGNEQIAPFVHPEIGGKVLDKTAYQTKIYTAPHVAPEKVITSRDLTYRLFGEEIGSTDNWEARQRKLAVQYLRELDWSITRREELMCSELLTTGKLTIAGDGYASEEIDFWGELSPSERPYVDIGATNAQRYWDGNAATILADLVLGADTVEDNSNTSATMAVLGAGAAAALRNNSTLWQQLDNRRVNPGELVTRRLGNGLRYLGTFYDSGVELYTYRGKMKDPVTGNYKKLIPDDLVLFGSREAKTSMNYGLVEVTEGETMKLVRGRRVPDSWMQRKKPAGRILRIASRPLPLIEDLDAFLVMKVLGS